jgi:hypothetical protein
MYTLIEHKKLDAAAASITFSNIPQNFTDLKLVLSLRSGTAGVTEATLDLNGVAPSARYLRGNGATASSGTSNLMLFNASTTTANTFSNVEITIPNYTSTVAKSGSADLVVENNTTSTFVYQYLYAFLWNVTSAVTSITITDDYDTFRENSSATLYGINRTSAIGRSPQAIGGYINYANGYWYHTFTGSGSFVPFNNMEVEYLVVAGGGGGGSISGGGGAGGLLTGSGQLTPQNYSVVVGAGGAGTYRTAGGNGSTSSAFGLSTTGGGGGGSNYAAGSSGGSGGGHTWTNSGYSGIQGQGNRGGDGGPLSTHYTSGGGGGAGSAGANGTGTDSGDGGAGLFWGERFYAGGGGGALQSRNGSNVSGISVSGGIGGGGNGGVQDSTATVVIQPSAGEASTGGGGGGNGDSGTGGAGGSGVVIIRYKG